METIGKQRTPTGTNELHTATMVAIGHETDESLAELAADSRGSTPSNAAELLVPDRKQETIWLESTVSALNTVVRTHLTAVHQSVLTRRQHLLQKLDFLKETEKRELRLLRMRLDLRNPSIILQRGYARLRKKDLPVSSSHDLLPGDKIDIILYDGIRKAHIYE